MMQVAVLRGGPSDEREVSLKSGAQILSSLSAGKYKTLDVFIDNEGVWHVRGVPTTPEKALCTTDVVFNALHGSYGEDGQVQRLLERINIPYTGSGALSSALAMNKALTKEMLAIHNIKTPNSITLSVSSDLENNILEAFRSFPMPCVIKPANSGSSVGVTLAKSFDEFRQGVKDAFKYSKDVLVEQFIKGKEATVGVVDKLRGEDHYTLPPIHVIPHKNAFYNYDAKYTSDDTEIECPGNFSKQEAEELRQNALLAHKILGLKHYSRSDFIVSDDGVYFLEVNTLPGLSSHSCMPKSLNAVGVSLPEFLGHVIELAALRR